MSKNLSRAAYYSHHAYYTTADAENPQTMLLHPGNQRHLYFEMLHHFSFYLFPFHRKFGAAGASVLYNMDLKVTGINFSELKCTKPYTYTTIRSKKTQVTIDALS